MKRWTNLDDTLIRESYRKEGVEWLSKKLDRSENSIKVRAKRLGVTKRRTYPVRRDWASPGNRGDGFIKQNFASLTYKELAAALDVSIPTVFRRMKFLGLKKRNRPQRAWTKSDDRYLIKNFKKMKLDALAEHFETSASSISRRARMLGLRKFNQSIWNAENDKLLIENYTTQSVEDLAAFFHVSEQIIYKKGKKLGLKRPKFIRQEQVSYFCPQCKVFISGKPGINIVCADCGKTYRPMTRSPSPDQSPAPSGRPPPVPRSRARA